MPLRSQLKTYGAWHCCNYSIMTVSINWLSIISYQITQTQFCIAFLLKTHIHTQSSSVLLSPQPPLAFLCITTPSLFHYLSLTSHHRQRGQTPKIPWRAGLSHKKKQILSSSSCLMKNLKSPDRENKETTLAEVVTLFILNGRLLRQNCIMSWEI